MTSLRQVQTPQESRLRMARNGVVPGLISASIFALCLAIAFGLAAAKPSRSSTTTPGETMVPVVGAAGMPADAAAPSQVFPMADESGSGLTFGFLVFDAGPGGRIAGFGPLTKPPQAQAAATLPLVR